MAYSTPQLQVPSWPYACNTLIEVAQGHARRSSDQAVFTFLDYATEVPREAVLNYETLDLRARQIAALLQTRAQPGARVLLLYPAGIEYICAFFGCLYAGMIAVPAYPPLNPRLKARLMTLALDCEATLALTTTETLKQLGSRASTLPQLTHVRWLSTDSRLDGFEHDWLQPAIDGNHIAFLQYTSGSTGNPKGVMVTHGNLLHNLQAIALQMQLTVDDHVFSWLPPYHDMGLIGSLLSPFCAGIPLTFTAPLTFLRRPVRWLREITARQCTVSGGPDFAYKLCLEKITDQELIGIDLSTWTLAFSGAEPVRWETIERFAERFAHCGFKRQAFFPCYGMAETTLLVTGKQRAEPPSAIAICRETYARHRQAVLLHAHTDATPGPRTDAHATQWVVACGMPAVGLDVAVVDPNSLGMVKDGEVGEIVVAGDSVAAGYWQKETVTAATFYARIPGHDGTYLRTGDLGFMLNGELYVSGRLKDVIIIRGVNHYPQDIEHTVDHCHPAIRSGCGISFSITVGLEEHLIFVQEVGRRDDVHSAEILHAIRAAIVALHDVQPHTIVLVENGSIHKTTSGKLSRQPCREAFINNRLNIVAQWTGPTVSKIQDLSLKRQSSGSGDHVTPHYVTDHAA